MSTIKDRGMVTAEYTVGTIGAVFIALILYRLGMLEHGSPWFKTFKAFVERALDLGRLFRSVPGPGWL